MTKTARGDGGRVRVLVKLEEAMVDRVEVIPVDPIVLELVSSVFSPVAAPVVHRR